MMHDVTGDDETSDPTAIAQLNGLYCTVLCCVFFYCWFSPRLLAVLYSSVCCTT